MYKSFLGIYFIQSWRKVRSTSWTDTVFWCTFEKEKQVESCLKKLFSANLTSTNLRAGRNQKPYSQHFPFYWLGNWVTTQGTELPKATQPDGGTGRKPRSPDTRWLQPSLLDLGRKHSVKRHTTRIKRVPVEKSLFGCGKIRRGKWKKCQTLVHEITKQ